jgi:hypothetical protein
VDVLVLVLGFFGWWLVVGGWRLAVGGWVLVVVGFKRGLVSAFIGIEVGMGIGF